MGNNMTEAELAAAAEVMDLGNDLHRLKKARRTAVDAMMGIFDRIESVPREDVVVLQERLKRHVLPGLMPYVSPTVSAAAKLAEALAQRPPAGNGFGGADVPRALRWLADVVEASRGQ